MNQELMKPYQARNVNAELGIMQAHQWNNLHLPHLFPTEYHSPHSLGLSDLAFLAQAQAVAAAVGGWIELARTTLGSPTSTIDVSSIPDKRYYQVLVSYVASIDSELRFNGISTTTYADRTSLDGGTDATLVNQNKMIMDQAASSTNARFINGYVANFDTKEKLAQFLTVKQQTAGAGTVANRTEAVGKHAQTTNPIDQMTVVNTGGNFPIGAELVVLGWSPPDVHTTNYWVELASEDFSSGGTIDTNATGAFSAQKYLWIQCWRKVDSTNGTELFRLNNISTSDYASRFSFNGGIDSTSINQTSGIINAGVAASVLYFTNIFIINNSPNEKLCIIHDMDSQTAGAGTAPNRRENVTKLNLTSAQITRIAFNRSAGNYTAGTIKVWGAN